MNNRFDDPRFTGAGLVCALFGLCCLVLGGVIGAVIAAALA